MNPAITNLAVSLGAMQIARRLPTEDPQTVFYLRCFYLGAQALSILIYYYVMTQIRKKNDLTVIKYVQPKSPMQPDSKDELVTTTVRDYDLAETSKAMKGLFTGMAFMGFLHLYMGYIPPLFVQSITTLKAVLEANETKLHLWNKKADGPLARPFKAAPGLMEQLTGAQAGPQTDAASIKAAEKPVSSKSKKSELIASLNY
ncbi:inorganic phosphate transporter pho88 [Trichosporon asahii var. asahii CBS 8904]|uniref:Inorganic phosphate transporter pho88 n=1 Tax=Trichosporon asahii var. asahii (strain CBS 8904) TaxID=1220162 RepID=K1WFH6_TRIAC|nr:inorganic phosphate transporter pho88 [Trichosporon asahii var. asahii CBS 8904]